MAKKSTPVKDLGDSLVLDAQSGSSAGAIPDLNDGIEAAETRRSAAEAIREEAGKFGSQAADRARALAGEGKDKASGALDEVAKMMHSAAADVDERLGADYGRYARSAADGISGFADTLRGKEIDDLIGDATAFVKKSPVIAIGTAAAVGFVLARLIKSGIDAAADLGDSSDDAKG